MKTVNVQVTIQLDIKGEEDIVLEVQRCLETINDRIFGLDSEPQIFVESVDLSNIIESNGGFEIGDEVEAPEPTTEDLYNHSFVGVIIDFRGDNAIVEDGDGDAWEIEIDRLCNPNI